MARIAQIGLTGAIVFAVLSFGGTEPVSFSFVQVLLLGLAVPILATHRSELWGNLSPPVAVPLVLVLIVLLQVVPIPGLLVELVWGAAGPASDSLSTISIVPYATLAHLLQLLTYLTVFYLTIVVCRRPNGKKHLILVLLGLGAFEALYGMVQYLTGWQQIFTFVKKYNLESATGTYINGNHFAGLLEMVLPFALALVFYYSSMLRQAQLQGPARLRNILSHQELQKLIFCLFLAVILFVSLIFSRSRMGIMSAFLSTVFILVLLATSAKQRKAGLLIGGAFLAAGIWIASWIGPGPVIARFEHLEGEYSVPGQGRLAIWQDTSRLIGRHPWVGSGLGTFPVEYTSEQTAFLALFVNHAHNDFLEILSELGLVGGTLLFGSIFYLLVRAIRCFFARAREDFGRFTALGCTGSLVAILLHSLTDFNLYIPANAMVLAVVLGLAWLM